MTQDDEAILAMHDSRMSVDSIAAMMGAEPCRIRVRLDRLLKVRDAACAPAHEPEVARRIVEAWGRARASCRAVAVGEAVIIELRNPAGTIPSSQGKASGVEAATGDSPVASAPTIKAPPTAYLGVTPTKLRYCRWFLAAGWKLGTTARLFDIEPEDLREALR